MGCIFVSMKTLFAFLILCVVSPSVSRAQAPVHDFRLIAQSADSIIPPDWTDTLLTTDLNLTLEAAEYRKQMDSTLNFVYRAILNDYRDDTSFIRKFKLAEDAWLTYRDAELGAMLPYPHNWNVESAPQRYYYYIEEDEYRDAITKRRIEELMMWYTGNHEGCDNCSFRMPGHVKH